MLERPANLYLPAKHTAAYISSSVQRTLCKKAFNKDAENKEAIPSVRWSLDHHQLIFAHDDIQFISLVPSLAPSPAGVLS